MKNIEKILIHIGCLNDSFISYASTDLFNDRLLQCGIYNSQLLCGLNQSLLDNEYNSSEKKILSIIHDLESKQQQYNINTVLAHFPRIFQNPELLPQLYQILHENFKSAEIHFYLSISSWVEIRRAQIFLEIFFKGNSLKNAIKNISVTNLYNYNHILNILEEFFAPDQYTLYVKKISNNAQDSLNAFLNEANVTNSKKIEIHPALSFEVDSEFLLLREKYLSMNPHETQNDIHSWYDKSLQHLSTSPFPLFISQSDRNQFLNECYLINKRHPLSNKLLEECQRGFNPQQILNLKHINKYNFIENNINFLSGLKHTLDNEVPIHTNFEGRIFYKKVFPQSFSNFTLHPDDVKCCVLTSTFNHEQYITEAIESVIKQQVDFKIAHIISDDGSNDGTQKIIRDYASRYEHIIPILHKKNNGPKNTYDLFDMARGCMYVALCDGDDYFTDPLKLQKQVDFLEAHPECGLCFHPVDVLYEDGSPSRVYPPENLLPGGIRKYYTIKDLLFANLIQTNSVMYRWRFREGLPGWFDPTLVPGDWYWHLLHAEIGLVGYLREHMAVYRRHATSLYASAEGDHVAHRSKHGLSELRTYNVTNRHFRGRYSRDFQRLAAGVFADFLQIYLTTGDDALLQKACSLCPEFAREFLAQVRLSEAKTPTGA